MSSETLAANMTFRFAGPQAPAQERLMQAAWQSSAERIKAALSEGADPLILDEDGKSALMRAAYAGDPECVALLLPLSNPLTAGHLGITPLMLAAQNGRTRALRQLLPVSDPNAVDAAGQNALMQACSSGHILCIEILAPATDPLTRSNARQRASDLAQDKGKVSLKKEREMLKAMEEAAELRASLPARETLAAPRAPKAL